MLHHREQSSKKLNKWDIIVLAFGAMIGWAWVVQSGVWIKTAGSFGAMLAFLCGGIIVLFVGQVYAEMTASVPGRGVLDFTLTACGEKTAFIATWSLTLGYLSVCAFEAVAVPNVLTYLFPELKRIFLYSFCGSEVYLTWLLVGIASTFMITIVNIRGAKTAAILQTVLTVIIGIGGGLLIVGGFVNGDVQNLHPAFTGGLNGFVSVLAMTPFLFVGFDVIPSMSGEMNIPQKKVGGILILSIVMATAWYMLIVYGTSVGLTAEKLENSSIASADAIMVLFGNSPAAAKILILGGLAGILTSWNAFMIGGSRAIAALAQEGLLPEFLGKKHPRFQTPINAILLMSVLTCAATFLGEKALTWLANAGCLGIMLTYLLVSISCVRLRIRQPNRERPYKMKHWKFFGYGSVVICATLLLMYLPHMPAALKWPNEWMIVLVWTALGIFLCFILKFRSGNDKETPG